MIRTIHCTPCNARKPYQCLWCGEPIERGELYVRALVKVDDSVQDQKWHSECLEHSVLIDISGEFTFDAYSNTRPVKDALAWVYPE